jgi:hypothetical protein
VSGAAGQILEVGETNVVQCVPENWECTMENRQTQQISEFKVIGHDGREYSVFEYQEGVETRSRKWMKAGASWFCLGDGTPVDKIDDYAFTIPTIDGVLHRQR